MIDAQKEVYGESPQAIMLENVKNLRSHDKGNTFKVIKEALESRGYTIKAEVLNSMDYGNVPQNRERIYIVGFLDPVQTMNYKFPSPIPLTNLLNKIVNRGSRLKEEIYKEFYYTDKVSFLIS